MTRFMRAELSSRRRMLAGLGGGAFVLMVIVAVSYHSIGLTALGQAFHGKIPRAIGAFAGSRETSLLSPHGWMGFGFNHPLFLTLTLTVAIAIGSGAIAGEVDSGRAELIFTRPVARTRFLGSSVLIWLSAEIVVILAGLFGGLFGGAVSSDIRHAGLAPLLWAPVQYLPLAFFVAACAFLASAWAPTRGKALGAAVGVTVLGYLLNVVSGLIGSLDWLHWLSPFGYYDPGAAIAHGLRWSSALELTGASVVLLLVARAQLLRRDLA